MLQNFVGYHGTSEERALKIIETNFIINNKKVGWLGTGIYLFDNNKKMAEYWAKDKKKYKLPGVIKCEFALKKEEIFDSRLPESDENVYFFKVREMLKDEYLKRKKSSGNAKKDFDGIVYNFICKNGPFKVVIANTYTYDDYDRKQGIPFSRVPNATELCVKDPIYITDKIKI